MTVIEGKLHRMVIDGVDVTPHVCVMSGSNMGKTGARELARALANRDDLEELDAAALENIRRTVTGRTPGRGPELQSLHIAHLQPGESMQWPTVPVTACDVCGCACRVLIGCTCNSCREGMKRAKLQLTVERMRRQYTAAMAQFIEAAAAAANSAAEFTRALSRVQIPGFYGPSPLWGALNSYINPLVMIHPDEPAARRFAADRIEPFFDAELGVPYEPRPASFDDFMAGMVDSIAGTFNIPREALLTPTPFSMGFDFSIIERHASHCWPVPAEPVMKRNKRNRGPEQHGKWWNKRGRR